MIKQISKWILKLLGWQIDVNLPPETQKAVMLVAPHTSNLDFFIGRLVFNVVDLRAKFLIKKEAFKFPFGKLLTSMGGIPVDRGRHGNLVQDLARQFQETDRLMLVVTPEGSRKYRKYWKKGFYFIAREAQVPIAMGFVDYKHKKAGINGQLVPTGDIYKDFEMLKDFYKNLNARFPEKYCSNPAIK